MSHPVILMGVVSRRKVRQGGCTPVRSIGPVLPADAPSPPGHGRPV